MSIYIMPIIIAIMLFPLLAVFITFPYMIYQYRKYGSIPILRSIIIYSFILYLLCACFLVMMPLSVTENIDNNKTIAQLIPFKFVVDFLNGTSFSLFNYHTWLKALKENYVLQVIFNILLFIPFGIYLKYYFRFSWKKVLILSFSLSMFFELTQLSGLYGIYQVGYRLFDVDDLILNTSGGMIGYAASVLMYKILPSREQLDKTAYKKGLHVSLIRRILAFSIDWAIIIILLIPVMGVGFIFTFHLVIIPSVFVFIITILYFAFSLYLTKGYTPGKKLLNIRVVTYNNNAPSLLQCLIRYFGLYLLFIPFWFLWTCYYMFMFIMVGKRPLIYERISGTYCISTVTLKCKQNCQTI